MTESKQHIRDVAIRLFNERGYDKVSLRDIAREAGVAIGSLTYHFKRKEDLLDAILSDLHAGFSGTFDPALGGQELLAHLVDLFVAGEDNQRRYPFYFENITQIAQCSERVAEEARDFEEGLYAHYRDAFETLAKEGLLREGHTPTRLDALSFSLVTMQAGWSMGAGPYANGVGPKVRPAAALAALVSACLSQEAASGFAALCRERGIEL